MFDCGLDYHWEAIQRILFVYAVLNSGVGYIQGMNELMGPLYYVVANDTNDDGRAHAEADTFWLFVQLMSEWKDLFVKSLDADQRTGVGASLQRLQDVVQRRDPELYRNLVRPRTSV